MLSADRTLGHRIGKKVDGALTKGWLYDDELRIVGELDGAGQLVSRFVYGTHVNVPDYMIKGGVLYELITDEQGSVRLVVNATSGDVAQRLDYDPFGRVTFDNNPGFQPFGYGGGQYDPDTKLVRFGHREYDSETDRWMSRDPITFRSGESNLYEYAGGDPINLSDPTGLTSLEEEVAVASDEGTLASIRQPVQLYRVLQKAGCVAIETVVENLAFDAAMKLTKVVYVGALGEGEAAEGYAEGIKYVGRTTRRLVQRLGLELQRSHRDLERLVAVIEPGLGVSLKDLEATMADQAARRALDIAGVKIGADATRQAMDLQLIANKVKPAGGKVLSFCK